MEIENLPEKIKQAKDAVECLEEPLKTEAFKKILDKLLEAPMQVQQQIMSQQTPHAPVGVQIKTKRKRKNGSYNLGENNRRLKEESEREKRELSEKVNRSEYPDIYDLKKILPEALYVLKIMKKKGEKSLTPPEIQFILKESFGISRTPESVSVALNRIGARKYTHKMRIKVGKVIAYKYELMVLGEEYLKKGVLKKTDSHEDKVDDGEEPDLS